MSKKIYASKKLRNLMQLCCRHAIRYRSSMNSTGYAARLAKAGFVYSFGWLGDRPLSGTIQTKVQSCA